MFKSCSRFLSFSTTVSSVLSLFPLEQSLGLLFFLIVTGFWSQPWLLGVATCLTYPNNAWRMALRGVTLSLTGWGQKICSCPHFLMPSWGLLKYCKSACRLHPSLPNPIYPQPFLKQSRHSCVPILLRPALRAQPMECLYPPCCQHAPSPYSRRKQKADSLLTLLAVNSLFCSLGWPAACRAAPQLVRGEMLP